MLKKTIITDHLCFLSPPGVVKLVPILTRSTRRTRREGKYITKNIILLYWFHRIVPNSLKRQYRSWKPCVGTSPKPRFPSTGWLLFDRRGGDRRPSSDPFDIMTPAPQGSGVFLWSRWCQCLRTSRTSSLLLGPRGGALFADANGRSQGNPHTARFGGFFLVTTVSISTRDLRRSQDHESGGPDY